MSVGAVQARIVELQSAITAVSRPTAPPPAAAPQADFGGVLATALAGQGGPLGGSAAGLPGTFGLPGAPGLPGSPALPGATSVASMAAALTGAAPGTAVPTSVAAAGPGTGGAFVEAAKKYLGVPYVWGGESLAEGGLDCSGLVQLAMKDIGVDVPRVARDQMKIGTEVPSLDQARPGDLVVTRGGGHIGIFVGDNKWIHAPYPGEKVKLAEMTTPPTTIRRVLPA
ncbi:C40 family peptidase [Georgenia sp. H159]|uniref:C40 family peptidase n=1 Tax=Georgenia sp. H159 TaxID=3076115 RepID=UPI002D7713D6|nr:C40 family peptidase [Georgenia sp. H159]